MYTTVRELVENALDSVESISELPVVEITIEEIKKSKFNSMIGLVDHERVDAALYDDYETEKARELVKKFGIDPNNAFAFWDWVGSRYNVCSVVGVLPLSLQYGFQVIEKLQFFITKLGMRPEPNFEVFVQNKLQLRKQDSLTALAL
ncbi:hypothetical protein RIF29_09705 [Crotalaria pallida]|uniref:Uncharacterized protein n=1 Tax=Crotalaria pallida TaxID=3830 RepID=A0AAN9FUZ1_CROPI